MATMQQRILFRNSFNAKKHLQSNGEVFVVSYFCGAMTNKMRWLPYNGCNLKTEEIEVFIQ